jgi:heat shock protein HspQ
VQCCEDETWQTENGILDEPGVKQTFYHLLVDSRDWDDVPPDSAIVYVSEAQLVAPQVPPLKSEI